MNWRRSLVTWVASALALTFATPGFGYCLTRTCTQNCEQSGICVTSGLPLFWPNSCVSFDVQKDGSLKLGISAATLDAVATRAFARWMNADCGSGTHPSIRVFDMGYVDCAKPEYNTDQPNANIITFHDESWDYTNTTDTLALTTVFFDPKSGEIYDANIEINSNQYDFADGNPGGDQLDLNAVLTHETGHFLGLSHSDVPSATMYSSYSPDMATLDPDDETGICLSLPPNRPAATNPALASCTPRHGFSGECGLPESGCCSTAIGSTGSTEQTWGLLAFGFGYCAWRARKRLKRARALPR